MPEYKCGLRAQQLDVFTTCTHRERIIEAKSFGNQLDGRTGEVLLISSLNSVNKLQMIKSFPSLINVLAHIGDAVCISLNLACRVRDSCFLIRIRVYGRIEGCWEDDCFR